MSKAAYDKIAEGLNEALETVRSHPMSESDDIGAIIVAVPPRRPELMYPETEKAPPAFRQQGSHG